MANDQDLAGLPKDVREAVGCLPDMACTSDEEHAVATIRAEMLRLARENAELTRALTERLDICGAAVQRAERAEAELVALKRRIAEAPTAHIDQEGISVCDTLRDIGYYRGQRVALLPVGGEG